MLNFHPLLVVVYIKEFLLTAFVFEITDTYDSLRLSKFNV
jgi:hypothetical protein